EHHASRHIGLAARKERALTLTQPSLEIRQSADICETLCLVFETQHPAQIQQLELLAIELGQVLLGDGSVVADQTLGQAPRLGMAQATHILHYLLQRAVVGAYARAPVAFAPARG